MLKVSQEIKKFNGVDVLEIRLLSVYSGSTRKVIVKRINTPLYRVFRGKNQFFLSLPVYMAVKHEKKIRAIIAREEKRLVENWKNSTEKKRAEVPRFV
ncbi:MAG TPA: hypothetical protein PK102_08785 [bacterium]|nr:hypothetical protein [bacterium]